MKKVIMVIIMFLVICASIWFQMGFLNSIPFIGVLANFGVVLVAGIGLTTGAFIGGITGAIYGLLIDICYGRGVGINLGLYLACGLLSGKLNRQFSKGNKISMIMITLICTSAFEIIAYLLNMLLNHFDFSIKYLISTLILEILYNVLLTILFFKPILFLGTILNKSKNSYYLL